jgi:hypothetical protein
MVFIAASLAQSLDARPEYYAIRGTASTKLAPIYINFLKNAVPAVRANTPSQANARSPAASIQR